MINTDKKLEKTKETKISEELYSKIERIVIAWSIDGTKTAGYLTRQIMELLNKQKIKHEK